MHSKYLLRIQNNQTYTSVHVFYEKLRRTLTAHPKVAQSDFCAHFYQKRAQNAGKHQKHAQKKF